MIEILDKSMKYVQHKQRHDQSDVIDVVLVSLFLTVNIVSSVSVVDLNREMFTGYMLCGYFLESSC